MRLCLMNKESVSKQSNLIDFISNIESLLFIFLGNVLEEIKYLSVILNSQKINVTKLKCHRKTLTGFCMVQLACLSQKTFAGDEGDIAMKIKHINKVALSLISLMFLTTNSFAYSQKVLTTKDSVEIQIVKTKLQLSAYTTVSRSPDMINNLRLMFSSNQKNKVAK